MYGSNTTAPLRQGILGLTVHSGDIPATSHRVWWLRRMASTLTWTEPFDFFLWGYIKMRVYATPPPTLQEYGCLCQSVTCHVIQCAAYPYFEARLF
ncbi:hypothetical protein AVEN_77150-1 [Araneus ventricosus]|uniref:Uncharacterized protein n=1 Tax=Araneus ventricosus TaxID=182803 RepID=A0A4Y2PQI8_ARAVE|nr:hypothetical protein AVEN_77150-1 [Araneus ventricosus]